MISLNIEREMKLRALAKYLYESLYESWTSKDIKESCDKQARNILDILDSVELSTQEAWMAEERLREAEMVAHYSREAC